MKMKGEAWERKKVQRTCVYERLGVGLQRDLEINIGKVTRSQIVDTSKLISQITNILKKQII